MANLSLLLPSIQFPLSQPDFVSWETDLHRLPQPLASIRIIQWEAGAGEGGVGVPLPSFACLSMHSWQ